MASDKESNLFLAADSFAFERARYRVQISNRKGNYLQAMENKRSYSPCSLKIERKRAREKGEREREKFQEKQTVQNFTKHKDDAHNEIHLN